MTEKAIEIENLSFSYPDETACLHNISFSVNKGETFGLIGPNGAGKSTLLLHLNGVLRGEGLVKIFGKTVSKDNIKLIRKQVGIVFQDPNDQLFMPTIYDDVAFGPLNMGLDCAEIEHKVIRTLKDVGIEGYKDKSVEKLSLGEKKKISLASILILEPDILALDEPTSNLDPGTRRTLLRMLHSITKTKIIATHDLDLVFGLCCRVALIDKGIIVAEGGTLDILSDKELLEKHNLEVPLSLLLNGRKFDGRI